MADPEAAAPGRPGPELIAEVLEPTLGPLGFARGQVGADARAGQVIFCRGNHGSSDGGCVDLVLDVAATPEWRITDVRYWGFPADRWHLPLDAESPLAEQLAGLARSLPTVLP